MDSYASIPQFLAKYSVTGLTSAQVGSVWLQYGTLRTNEELAGHFATPFTTTNLTARELCIDYAYLGILLRTRNKDDEVPLEDDLKHRVMQLTEGGKPMILDDGTALYATKPRSDAWSTTMDEKPVFDLRDPVEQRIDPDRIDRERSEDT